MSEIVPKTIYKIISREIWDRVGLKNGVPNMPIDGTDGFVHLSTATQLAETLSLYFGGQNGVVIVAISTEKITENLVWEPSRGGALFPHFYGTLPLEAVIWHEKINVPADSEIILPDRVT